NGQGVSLEFDGKPFTQSNPDDYDGAEILDLVRQFIRRFIYLSDEQAVIVACWVAHTHAISVLAVTLYLNIIIAAKRRGKARLLDVLHLLVANPWLTGRVTAACLIRKIDKVHPCLLLDESDAAFRSGEEYSEALRGVLNNGFYEDGVASCCVGGGHEF